MENKLIRNWILIAVVLVFCGLELYPPQKSLVPGPDLAGGTTLLYEVDIPEGADTQDTLRRVIEVSSRRVDPAGVRNIQFQTVAGGRVQILMPHPSKEVVAMKDAYQDQLLAVTDSNLTRGELMAALRSTDGRDARLDALIRGVEARRPLLAEAAERFDALQAAQQARAAAGAEPGSERDIELAGRVAETEIALDETLDAVEATSLDPVRLGNVLEMSTRDPVDPSTGQPAVGTSPRAKALDEIFARYPDRREQIQKLVSAYDAYYGQKRPLEDPNDLIRLLKGQGVLEFRIAVDAAEAPNVDEMRETLTERGPRAFAEDAPMRWFAIENIESWLDEQARDLATDQGISRADAMAQLRTDLDADPARFIASRIGLIGASDGKAYYVLLWNTLDRSLTKRKEQPGWELTTATTDRDEYGRPAVGFQMNEAGANYLGALTENNIQRRMAIVLDGRVYSAPLIRSKITKGGNISGRFTQRELDYLITTLSAGSLQARLSPEPIEIRTFGPRLGADNLSKGLKAGIAALGIVAVFMVFYYFGSGCVAAFALLANVVLILGIMATRQATFTLPGIAGIVLTIGMCVDANVLVFERIREELREGSDMLAALRSGYQKAFSSIIDGNLTNLIVCFILYYTGTSEVKGFAVTLGIGICATLFTSLFMTRTIFETWYRMTRGKSMPMLPMVVPAIEKALHPKIDWMSKGRLFLTVSSVALVLSIGFVIARGADILDIEFRSGTEVAFDLKEGNSLPLEEARQRLDATDITGATVIAVGETDEEHRASAFSVITDETDSDKVAEIVRTAFAGELDVQPVLSFAGIDRDALDAGPGQLEPAPVYPVTQGSLDEVIGRPEARYDVSEYRGGVAIVLDDLSPAVPMQTLVERIKSMRLQPEFEAMQFRPFEIITLQGGAEGVESAVVVSRDSTVNYFDNPEAWSSALAKSEWDLVRAALSREQSLSKVSRITPTVARTMANNAVVALILSFFAIVGYIWIRFGSLRYGLAAIAALLHDVTIALGLVAVSAMIYGAATGFAEMLNLMPFKIDMGMIAALLTIIGYSLNDTIVAFDRVRENRGKLAHISADVVNRSINQVISRTILTSATTMIAVLTIYLFGGEGIRGFAFALLIGVMVGTYSSIAIAAPLLLVGQKAKGPARGPATAGAGAAPAVAER